MQNAKKNAIQEEKKGDAKDACKIVIWANGFTVGDGPLRDLNDQKNKAFLNEIKEGYTPKELIEQFGGAAEVTLEDNHNDQYVPPKVKVDPFAGQGISIGSSAKEAPKVGMIGDSGKPVVDPSKPTTVVNIRLHNGQTVKLDLNTDHTVQDLFNFCKQVAPAAAGSTFNLIAGYPPKPLSDMTATMESAKLMKSAVTQKLV